MTPPPPRAQANLRDPKVRAHRKRRPGALLGNHPWRLCSVVTEGGLRSKRLCANTGQQIVSLDYVYTFPRGISGWTWGDTAALGVGHRGPPHHRVHLDGTDASWQGTPASACETRSLPPAFASSPSCSVQMWGTALLPCSASALPGRRPSGVPEIAALLSPAPDMRHSCHGVIPLGPGLHHVWGERVPQRALRTPTH